MLERVATVSLPSQWDPVEARDIIGIAVDFFKKLCERTAAI